MSVQRAPRRAESTICGMHGSSQQWLLAAAKPSREDLRLARRKLHAKATFIMALNAAAYYGLVLSSWSWPMRVLSAVLLTQSLTATATGIMHDGNHHAFSSRRWLNGLAAYSADALGASSTMWRRQHNDKHHRHTNIKGFDGDLNQEPFARLAPWQQHRSYHALQHIYMWPLYGALAMKWFVMGDFKTLLSSDHGKASLRDWASVLAGKAFHASWALILPMVMWSWKVVIPSYLAISFVVGFSLALTFQLAHCVDEADFVAEDVPHLKKNDAVLHQLATTVDVHPRTRLGRAYVRFLCGGLEYQVEHHLMPRTPHTFYPTLAARLQQVCDEHGIRRRVFDSVPQAIASHQRHLRSMGRANSAQTEFARV